MNSNSPRRVGRKSAVTAPTSLLKKAMFAGVLLAAAAYPALAQNNDTTTDYFAGYLEVTAEGTSKVTGNRVQMELLATEGARILAEVKMLKAITGVRVTGMTTLQDMIISSSKYASYVKGVVKGAITMSEEVAWIKDANSAMGESPRAKVVLRMCFRANSPACSKGGGGPTRGLLSAFRPNDLVPNAKKVPPRAEPMQLPKVKLPPAVKVEPEKKKEQVAAVAKQPETRKVPAIIPTKPYTGLIVNLADIPYLPVLAPQIHTAKGASLYDPRMVKNRYAVKYGYAEFVNSLASAKKLKRLGANPLIIAADDVDRGNNILVTEKVADLIARANKGGSNFLREAKIAIVVQN